MKKNIAVIANNKSYSEFIAEKLKIFFDEFAAFHCYGTGEIVAMEQLEEDYVVLSAFTIFQIAKKKVKENAKLIIVDLTLNKETLGRLYKVPKNGRALLVNIDYRNCMEAITMIYNLGYRHLELIPYYPGCEYDETVQIAVTPGEAALVPEKVSTVIDLGQRLLDVNSIFRVARAIEVENPFHSEEAKAELDKMVVFNPEMERVLGENSSLSVQMNTILKLVKQGIIVTDTSGKIYLANDMAGEMLDNRGGILKGFNLMDVLPEYGAASQNLLAGGVSDQLIRINGKNVMLSVSMVEDNGQPRGHVILLEYFNEAEDRQHKFRKKIMGSGHTASYTFQQILGDSQILNDTKDIAMRMANSESSICLFGESGTGKELFAQSIHNYSRRRDYSFVAINCSALPENLLESELYGYEEGAFSGARKGGKIGLFELAHKGTLFLDEIGELPVQMQAKLLRVIEEKKILKVGGKDLIDVDVRIVCATNRNLQQMVEAGEFRRDLFYRLCVLPIHIPPLRKREGDLFLLMETMKSAIGADFTLAASARERLRRYSWPGNVRELKNITEYLANLGKAVIESEDIPLAFEKEAPEVPLRTESLPLQTVETVSTSLQMFVLSALLEGERKQVHMGRQALTEAAKEKGVFATEQEIRSCLRKLNEAGLILSFKGRKGSVLTEKGRYYMAEQGE